MVEVVLVVVLLLVPMEALVEAEELTL